MSTGLQLDGLRDGAGSGRMRGLLVVAEIAMAMMLLVGGGLFIRSFIKLSSVDLGYDPEHVLTFQAAARRGFASPRDVAQLKVFADTLVERMQSLPGVRSVGYANNLPMIQFGLAREMSVTPWVPGVSPLRPLPGMHAVSRDFLKALGMRIVEGRGFSEHEGARHEPLITLTLARSRVLGDHAIGKSLYFFGNASWEVVGVVDDVRQWGLDRPPVPEVYTVDFVPPPPSSAGAYFAVRADTAPAALAASIRSLVRQLNPQATVDNVATMEQLVSNSRSRPRLYAVLLGIFAGVAVALAVTGIYGVMSYAVARRTREIGIRIALGAQRLQVLGLVLRQAMFLTLVGVALGILGAAAVTRFLETMLFGLTPLDPPTFVSVSFMFVAAATVAALVPARRATNVDPQVALRHE